MPKPNYRSLLPPPAATKVVVLPHPEDDASEVRIELRRMGPYEMARMVGISDELRRNFGETWYPMSNGESVQITEIIAQQVAMLDVMQTEKDEDERFSAEEFLGMMVTRPDDYVVLLQAANALHGEDPPGNS